MASQLMHSSHFKARPPRQYNIGRNTIMVYDRIDASMSPAEKAYAFNINKNALENLALSRKKILRSLGGTLDCRAVVSFTAAEFERVAYKQLREKIDSSATTYHSSNGYLIPEATEVDSTDTTVLKSIADHLVDEAKLRPDGIHFAKLTSSLSFKEVDPNHTTVHKFLWFHKLPVKPKKVELSAVGATPKVEKALSGTFIGHADWATLKTKRNNDENWDHPACIDKPFDLVESSIKDKNCNAEISVSSAQKRLEDIIFNAAEDMITKSIFNHLCPRYIDDPASAIIKIKQVYPDPTDSSRLITSSVSEYHSKTLQLVEQMGVKSDFTIDVVHHFFQHLAPKIKDRVKLGGYIGDTKVTSRKPYDQFKELRDLYERAVTAEYEISKQKGDIREVINTHHSFLATPAANLSTAERAIKNHKEPYIPECWGCKGPHSWWNTATKSVNCPHKDNPEYQAAAAARFEAHKEKKKKRMAGYKKRKQVETMMCNLLQDCESDEDATQTKTKVAEALIAKLSPQRPSKVSKFKPSSSLILLTGVVVMQSATKPLLDMNIHRTLPHFLFHIGSQDSNIHPQLEPAYDTCAALNCGFLPYHTAIAKSYPHLVKSITHSGDIFSPIMLRGVVEYNREKHETTTALTAVIEYYTPYVTSTGAETTLKVALGNDVSSNLILGIATIKAGKFIFDPCDDTISSAVLDNFSPTAVTYKNTIRGTPANISPAIVDANMSTHCQTIVKLANSIENASEDNKANVTEVNEEPITKAKPDAIAQISKVPEDTNKVHFSFLNHGDPTPYFG